MLLKPLGHLSNQRRTDSRTRLREAVLRTTSISRLGIDPPVLLCFHDSARGERQRHGDPRASSNVDLLEVEAAIRRIIDEVKPQVILTLRLRTGARRERRACFMWAVRQ